jgi:hypothetical protein
MPMAKIAKNTDLRISVHPIVRDFLDYEARKRGMQRATFVEKIISNCLLDRKELRREIDAIKAATARMDEASARIDAIADLIVDQSARQK